MSEAKNISEDNNGINDAENRLRKNQCAEGRIGPLCSKCGPFGEYLEVPDQIMLIGLYARHVKNWNRK